MVPLDGFPFAESALSPALTISRRTGADVHLVTVQEPPPSFVRDEWAYTAREWSEQYIENVVERAEGLPGGSLTVKLLAGHVVEALEAEVDACDADLVVMATHGRGALSRAWLGSVTDRFVHQTDRPVLLVRPEEGDEPPDIRIEAGYDDILVPLDGSELSESVLDCAADFGEMFEASFRLVRVVPYPLDVASPYLPTTFQMNQGLVDDARDAAREYLEEQAERLRKRGFDVAVAARVDVQPGHGILKEAEESGATLIAMATHGRTGLRRALLGGATDKVLRGAHVPVLLHRHAE
jgi:nucleotide-binding universal stress UspA family protein